MIKGCLDYVDLPPIPEDVKQKILKDAEYFINIPVSEGDRIYYFEQIPARYGPDTVYFKYFMYPPVEFVQDALQPLFDKPLVYVLSVAKCHTGNPSMFWPHTDHDRWSGVQINLDNGGDNVLTRFHKKFPKRENMYDNLYDLNELDDTEEIKIEENKWLAFNPTVCHSVHNITGVRVTLALDIGDLIPYDKWLRYFDR
jgi:hypothetical protein